MAEDRRLPRGPLLVRLSIFVPFVALAWWSVHIENVWLAGILAFIVAPLAGNCYFRSRRCPVCNGPMVYTHRPDGSSTGIWLDCYHCNIHWDTGKRDPEGSM